MPHQEIKAKRTEILLLITVGVMKKKIEWCEKVFDMFCVRVRSLLSVSLNLSLELTKETSVCLQKFNCELSKSTEFEANLQTIRKVDKNLIHRNVTRKFG
jgi:hypothetical protein